MVKYVDRFVAHFVQGLSVKEFWKSINISRSYRPELGVLFFWLTVYINCGIMCIYWEETKEDLRAALTDWSQEDMFVVAIVRAKATHNIQRIKA